MTVRQHGVCGSARCVGSTMWWSSSSPRSPPAHRGAGGGEPPTRDRDRLAGRVGSRGVVVGDEDRPPRPGARPGHGDVTAEADQRAAAEHPRRSRPRPGRPRTPSRWRRGRAGRRRGPGRCPRAWSTSMVCQPGHALDDVRERSPVAATRREVAVVAEEHAARVPTVGSTSPSVSRAARSATSIALDQGGADGAPASPRGAVHAAQVRVGAEPAAGTVDVGEDLLEDGASLLERRRVGDDEGCASCPAPRTSRSRRLRSRASGARHAAVTGGNRGRRRLERRVAGVGRAGLGGVSVGEGLTGGEVVAGATPAAGDPGLGVAAEPELPGRAWATTAERTPAAAIDPATSQRVIRETRRSPVSLSAAPALISDTSSLSPRGRAGLPGFQAGPAEPARPDPARFPPVGKETARERPNPGNRSVPPGSRPYPGWGAARPGGPDPVSARPPAGAPRTGPSGGTLGLGG